jgi:DNA invertase Pin-like site-specific DNA recombinase
LAEQERDFISQRTKSALRAAKERGTKLGAPKQHLDALAKARQAKAHREAQQFSGIIMPLRKQGATLKTSSTTQLNGVGRGMETHYRVHEGDT